tara:strand:- start:4 stop:246 length:243 start_codon:yes stop_codon:yes gene_type:complete
MFINAKTIIKKIFNTKEKEQKDFLKIKESWKKNFSTKIKQNVQIEDFTNNILTIKTKNPSWKTEITLLKNEVKKNFHPVK